MDHSTPNQNRFQKLAWPVGLIIVSLAAAFLLFKGYVLHPNKYMYTFGGDGLVIYYDMIFHAAFGNSSMFTGMNYPYGEYIFLTDCEGAVSTVLQWINKYVVNIETTVPGIIHFLNIILLPASSIFIFYLLKYFKVQNWLAFLFGILITFLSPQMFRFGVHFGLAYPFLIPLTMLWSLRKFNLGILEKRDFFFLGVLIFFFFNNPYIGFTSAGLLLCTGALLGLTALRHPKNLKPALWIGSAGLLAILIPFIVFRLYDPVSDRLEIQWGFFYYHATLEGLFYPPGSLLNDLLLKWGKPLQPVEFEGQINLGFVSILLGIGALITGIVHLVRKNKSVTPTVFSTAYFLILGSAALMFLYAANTSIFPVSQSWLEEHLGPLLMFKASGRLGWPLYFAIAISGVVFLDQVLKKIKVPVIRYGLAGVLAAIWAFEIHSYVGVHYKDCFHENFFSTDNRQKILDTLSQNQVDVSEFQGMLVLPKMMAWNDNFISDLHWASQFYSLRISAATGIPLMSAMLSRMSVGQMAEAIQMLSNPVIERSLPGKLPNDKPILILLGGNSPPLKIGEQYLIDKSTPVYLSNDFSLYRLTLDSLSHNTYVDKVREAYHQKKQSSSEFIHLSYDETSSDVHFFGNGSLQIPAGQTVLVDSVLPMTEDTQFVFSAWINIDHHRPGIGEWQINVIDSTGQLLHTYTPDPRRSNDIQNLWIRHEVLISAPGGARLKVLVNSPKALIIDEVLIYPEKAEIFLDAPGAEYFLYNGFRVSKKSS